MIAAFRPRFDRLRPAVRPFTDVYTAHMVRHHLRFVVVTFVVILAAVTAINVSAEVTRVWDEGLNGGDTATAIGRTALYVWCRLLDNGSQIFGIAFMLGIVWAEVAHAFGGRLLMVRTAGRSFVHRSSALLIVAALSVPTHFVLDNVVRPWAFMTLSREGLGEYGWRYAAARSHGVRWLSFAGAILQVDLHDAPEPRFEKATIYWFDQTGDLVRLASAEEIVPPSRTNHRWMLRGATVWQIGEPSNPSFGMPIARGDGAAGETALELGFSISRRWLEFRDIEPKYLPLSELWALTGDPDLPNNRPKYEEWLSIRLFQGMVPGLVAVCIGALFALAIDARGLVVAGGAALFTAYSGYFLNRLSALAVENMPLPPQITALLLPSLLVWAMLRLIDRIRRRDGLV